MGDEFKKAIAETVHEGLREGIRRNPVIMTMILMIAAMLAMTAFLLWEVYQNSGAERARLTAQLVSCYEQREQRAQK